MTGLTPRGYRRHLREAAGPLTATSQRGSTTVHYEAPSPLIGTALHHNHRVRDELLDRMALADAERLYEEDPGTERFLGRVLHALLPNQSRYEVDMNRPPDTALYLTAEMAWGAQVWEEPPHAMLQERILERWYEFHTLVDAAVEDAIERFGRAVVLDVHAFNHQRDGPADWRTDAKPVINLGTHHLDLDDEGRALVQGFLEQLGTHTLHGDELPVAENAVFMGGYLNRRLSRAYGPRCITLSVEYKKVFMDAEAQHIREDVLEELVDQFDQAVAWLGEQVDGPVREERSVPTPEPGPG